MGPRARSLLPLLVVFAACAHRVEPREPGLLEGAEFIDAVMTVPEQGPVRVELRVPRGFLPPGKVDLVAVFAFLEKDFPAAHVRRSVDGRLEPFPLQLTVSDDAPVVLAYEVTLPIAEKLSSDGLLGTSFLTPAGRHLALSTLLPALKVKNGLPLRRPGALRVQVPEGWRVIGSVAREGERFVVDDWVSLVLATVEVGKPAEVISQLGTRFVSSNFDAPTLGRLARLEERAEPVLTRLLGSRQRLRLVTVHHAENPTTGTFAAGLHQQQAISLRTEQRPSTSALATSSMVLLHELVHAHLPPASNLPKWIVEGVTDYLAARVAIELEGLPPERVQGVVEKAWARLGGRPLQSGDRLVPYTAGTVLGYCLDVRLRRDGASLPTVLARANVRAGGKSIDNAFWEQEIALASAPAGALLLSSRTEALDPPATCFAEAGLAAAVATTKEEGVAAVLRLPQLLAIAYGASVFGLRVDPKRSALPKLTVPAQLATALDPLKEGDLLLTVGGRPVDGLDDLIRALNAAPPGPLRLGVLRDGEPLDLVFEPTKKP